MPDIFDEFTLEEAMQAHLTYISRSITLKDKSDTQASDQNIILAPVADMFNHSHPTDFSIGGEAGTMNCVSKAN